MGIIGRIKENMDVMFNSGRELDSELGRRLNVVRNWIEHVSAVPDDLGMLLNVHKNIWNAGIRCDGIGPDMDGMFRTADIPTMSMGDVYMGDVNGIWRNSLAFFESVRESDPETYAVICRQYRGHLKKNLRAICSKVYDNGFSRERIVRSIEDSLRGMFHISGTVRLPGIIEDNSILGCVITTSYGDVHSDMLLLDGRIYLPQGFQNGVSLSRSVLDQVGYVDVDGCRGSLAGSLVRLSPEECRKVVAVHGEKTSGREIAAQMDRVRTQENRGVRFGI